MTIIEWLVENISKLREIGVDSPRSDCMVLAEDVLGKDRGWLITHPEHRLRDDDIKKLDQLITRRLAREPLAYIRGKGWFYGRVFHVSSSVMIPRPESEDFIELTKEMIIKNQQKAQQTMIIDAGTGSGCIAITAKLEFPKANVIAIDNDNKALREAKRNSEVYKTTIDFIHSDLFNFLKTSVNEYFHSNKNIVVLANLPYVPEEFITSPEITFEPKQAIFSGKSGLDHYNKFWKLLSSLLLKPQHIMTESMVHQHKEMVKLASKSGYELRKTKTLIQYFEKSES